MENIEQWAVDFQQRDWVWRREGLQNITCGINLYWKDNMTVIREVLQMIGGGPDLFDEFRRGSCFGHLIDFVGGNSCNNAIHALLSREVIIDGAGEHDTWFRVGGTNIRFSPTEFALVTGLQFGGSDFDTSASYDFHGSSFYAHQLNKTPLKVKDLLELFRTFSLGVDPDDYIMVVGVLFVHTMIFGYDQTHMIEDWVWALAEDQARWNSFPWGAYAFSLLQHYMELVPSTEAELRKKGKKAEAEKLRLSYHFYGPVWALLVWAYEALPRLGQHCARVSSPDSLPRCLNWTFKMKTARLGTLFADEQLCLIYLQPSELEAASAYYRSVMLGNLCDVIE